MFEDHDYKPKAVSPTSLFSGLWLCSTQSEPGDLEAICGTSASEVQAAINELCDDDSVGLALEAYDETCSGSGYDSCKLIYNL